MPLFNTFLVRVTESKLYLYSSVAIRLDWAKGRLVSGKNIPVGQIDSSTPDWLIIQGFDDHDKAVSAATYVVKKLLEDGWQHQNYEEYVDGHWFKKQI